MPDITLTFVHADGREVTAKAQAGDLLLTTAQSAGIELEGACGGHMACSTCHVIMDPRRMSALPAITLEEEEMLDLAAGLTATSRLSCQITVTQDLDGARICVPELTNNLMGF